MAQLIKTRVSILMFFQFAVWGSWAPVLGKHMENLGFTGPEIGQVYGTGALAIMISPLIAGQIADRWFATQKFLGISFLVSGLFFFLAGQAAEFESMWNLSLAAMLFFGPTLGLANSLSFTHLNDPRKDFPVVRVWGTIGWIAAGWALSLWMYLNPERSIGDCLYLGAAFSGICGVFSLTLPHTPPKEDVGEKFAVGKVLAMLKDPSFLVFSFLSFVLMTFASFYYFRAGNFFPTIGVEDKQLALVMSLGQVMEILTMFLLPIVYRKFGAKKTIALGLFAWALRFGVFALGEPTWLVIASQALHGVCFAFAIAAGMIYVERICTDDVRASAQSFLSWITYGFGMYVGAILGGETSAYFTVNDKLNWSNLWLIPAIGCLIVVLLFLLGFKARDQKE